MRSPKRSTSRPETKPDEKRAIAKAETISPIAALLTPKDRANTGMAGSTIPNPIATKKEAEIATFTSRGNPDTEINREILQQLLPEQLHNLYLCEEEPLVTSAQE